jgi:hypothetical protein
MKQLLIVLCAFGLGLLSYPFLSPVLNQFTSDQSTETNNQDNMATTSTVTKQNTVATQTSPVIVATTTPEVIPEKKAVSIDAQGALHDGPFIVKDASGTDTKATAEIIRSPEETLLQFKNVTFTHGASVELHLAKDAKGKDYLNLGPARLNSGVLVYGLPLDLDLGVFSNLLFYNPDTNVNEFVVAF